MLNLCCVWQCSIYCNLPPSAITEFLGGDRRVQFLAVLKKEPDNFEICLEVVLIAVSLAIKRACNLMVFPSWSREIMHSGQLFSWCKPSAM